MATTTDLGQAINGINSKSPEKMERSPIRHEGLLHKPIFQPHDVTRLHDSVEQTNLHRSPTKEESAALTDATTNQEQVQELNETVESENNLEDSAKSPEKAGICAPSEPEGRVVEEFEKEPESEPVESEPSEPAALPEAKEAEEIREETPEEAGEPDIEKPSEEAMETEESPAERAPIEGETEAVAAAPSGEAAAPEKSPKHARKSPIKAASPRKTAEERLDEPAAAEKRVAPTRKRKHAELEPVPTDDKTPLLEAPLVVEGKRMRQRTERLDSTAMTPERKEIEIPVGRGQKLGDIKFVDAMISKTATGSLKTLHRIMFGKIASGADLKKHLRQFHGFDFESDSKDFEKKKKQLDHVVVSELREICGVLGLERPSKKEDLCDAIMHYLMKPVDKGKETPKKQTPKRGSTKKKSVSHKKKTPGKRGRSAAAKEATSEEEVVERVTEKSPEPSAKKGKRGRPSAAPATTPAKKQVATPTTSSRSARKSAFPSDSDIKSTIKELLKGVNLEEVTMKEMMTKVYDRYPGQDLTSKKDFIKESVKQLLSNN